MRWSKYLIAFSACLLVIVGVAATKINQNLIVGFYYLTGGQCLQNPFGIQCTSIVGAPCLYTAAFSGPSTVYEYRLGNICVTPIYRDDY